MVFFKRKETAGNKETGKRFCRDSGAVSGEHVSRGHYHMHAITHASSGYKSQKKDRAENGDGKEKDENDRRKKKRTKAEVEGSIRKRKQREEEHKKLKKQKSKRKGEGESAR